MAASRKKLVTLVILVSIVLAAVCGTFILRKAMARPRLPVLGQIKSSTFTHMHNKEFKTDELYRHVWIAGVFSTPCQDGCDEVMKNMASLSRTFEQVTAVKLIAVSLKPVQDTPQVLADFSGRYVQGKGNWFFLTGKEGAVEDFVGQQLRLELDPSGDFSPTLALVDRSGYVRGYYDGTVTAQVNQLFLDASLLLKERF